MYFPFEYKFVVHFMGIESTRMQKRISVDTSCTFSTAQKISRLFFNETVFLYWFCAPEGYYWMLYRKNMDKYRNSEIC